MSLYQRGDVWYYLFYVNGKRYRGSTGTENLKKAERVEARARVAAENDECLKPQRAPLLQDFAKKFLEFIDNSRLEAKSKRDYKDGWRLIAKSRLFGMRMDQITADDAETTKFHESPYTTNCALRTLRRMLHKAKDWKLIREVPKIKLVDAPRRNRTITNEEEWRLLNESPQPLKDVLTIMLDCGMRDGEVVKMRWEYMNWEQGFYFNPKFKSRKGCRPIPLSERVLALLKARYKGQKEPVEGWIFPSTRSRSGHLGLSGLEHSFRKLADHLGLPTSVKLYCARHTFGTTTMAETKNPALVRDVMGHANLSTTMIYLHPDLEQVKSVVDKANLEKQKKEQEWKEKQWMRFVASIGGDAEKSEQPQKQPQGAAVVENGTEQVPEKTGADERI